MSRASRTSLLIADPLLLCADALALALAGHPDLEVFSARPTNGPETVAAAVRLKPDFALIDYWMPDMEGPVITKLILAQVPQCNILLLSWLTGRTHIHRGLQAGALGFIPKDSTVAQVAEAIRRIYAGEQPIWAHQLDELVSKRVVQASVELERFETLTPRQTEILALLNTGQSTFDIAKRLSITPKTVSNHISDILAKTNTFSQTEVLAKARGCGFLRS